MDKTRTIEVVQNLPLFHLEKVAVNYNETWSLQNHAKAVVENGTDKAIAFVSNRYNLIQFKDVLMPVIEGIDSFNAKVKQHSGVCIMEIFPDIQEFKDETTTYGISVINSVDRSTGIIIKFNVLYNNNTLSFPSKMAAFVKTHTAKGFRITQDYIEMITKVKDSWKNIIQNMPNQEVNQDNLKTIAEYFGIRDSYKEHISRQLTIGKKYNAWDIVELRLREISYRHFKSEIHKQKALDNLCDGVYKYAIFAGI